MERHIKIAVIGDSESGKSSIVQRLTTGDFTKSIDKTIGASYRNHIINLGRNQFRLCIWDTSGQDKYNHISKLYSRNSDVILIVCDGSSSCDQVLVADKWFQKMQHDDVRSDTLFFIVINKIDLVQDMDQVNQIESFAIGIRATVIKTSAKDNINIQLLFNSLTERYSHCKSSLHQGSIYLSTINHSVLTRKPKKKCCS